MTTSDATVVCRHCGVKRNAAGRPERCTKSHYGFHAWTTIGEHRQSAGQLAARFIRRVR